MTTTPAPIRRAATRSADPEQAVDELLAQFGGAPDGGIICFCAPGYDLARLGAALRRGFPGPLAGCTGSGQIGPTGYQADGIVAIGFDAAAVRMRPHAIRPLAECQALAAAIGASESATLAALPGSRAFGLILADGLSLAEERLAAALYQSLGDVPIVGGSAGDDLRFEHTYVLVDGEFVEDAAVFVLVETTVPFTTFKLEHFEPSSRRLVITGAEPERRCVTTIDGEPAAIAYARHVGVPVERLDGTVFSNNPLMLRIGGSYYVRSIQRVNPDHSITFLCAIEEGLVLSIGRCVDVMNTLTNAFDALGGLPAAVIGCDCILRRLEFEKSEDTARVGSFLAAHNVIGFSTYGEQFNGIHVNQTFVGVAIGTADAA